MKNILIKFTNLILVVILLASCSEDYLDVNVDPNNPSTVSPDLILPTAMKYTADVIQGSRRANTLGNLMMYNWSQADGYSWYTNEFNYLVNTSFYRGIFNDSYSEPLTQYQILENLEDEEYVYYVAIAKIMQSYHFQLLVDFYGDVPYFEALQRGAEATPAYDDAQEIYDDLIIELTSAIDLIDNAVETAIVPGNDDIIFGGEMHDWKAFANTIKMRILTRQIDMTGRTAYIQDEVNAIIAEGSGFITGDVGVNPGYLQEEGKQNPTWNTYGWDVGGTAAMDNDATCASDYIITYLQGLNDPRIDYIYEQPATGHLGVPQGLLAHEYDNPVVDAYVADLVSNIGPGILKSPNMDAIIFTLAESYFNQAEAALTITGLGNAQTLYENGIQASFDCLGAPGAATYISQPVGFVAWGIGGISNKELIITQKWIAMNGITAEQSWFDYSRTGYPRNLPISRQASTTDRPVRIYWPSGEVSANGGNLPDQPDAFTAKIFWAL
ncbi:MAG: SusD/RagB family nutrient-binding outer membrane lipoprotein [Marinilabiliales bacterium]|nr:MAG: SusD/RagB family nutrient-binding outer membrane lipoprotein [Marinilabiliales bacterium]